MGRLCDMIKTAILTDDDDHVLDWRWYHRRGRAEQGKIARDGLQRKRIDVKTESKSGFESLRRGGGNINSG
jgi:hypothetical protein